MEIHQSFDQFISEMPRGRVDVWSFSTVGPVRGAFRHRDVASGVRTVSPEKVGNSKVRVDLLGCFPELFALDKMVGAKPESNFSRIAKVPTVGDNAMVSRLRSGGECCLRGARDRREWGLQDHLPDRRTCQCLRDLGHLGVDVSGQANEIDRENFIRHVAKDNA